MHLTEKEKEKEKETNILIDFLFMAFHGLFPSSYSMFKSAQDVIDAKKFWIIAFLTAKIINDDYSMNEELFWKGFHSLPFLKQKFMPSCGQFIDLCVS